MVESKFQSSSVQTCEPDACKCYVTGLVWSERIQSFELCTFSGGGIACQAMAAREDVTTTLFTVPDLAAAPSTFSVPCVECV